MSLESTYFRYDYVYRAQFVNRCLAIVRYTRSEKRRRAFMNLLFKMMKDVVRKNIANYLNLTSGLELHNGQATRDELIAECYMVFDKCVEKFKLGRGYNFYFYYNKSLSRKFFRDYQRVLTHTADIEITDAIATVVDGFRVSAVNVDSTMDMLISSLDLNEIEDRVCRSLLLGKRGTEFIRENTDITNAQYSRALQRVKEVLRMFKETGEI